MPTFETPPHRPTRNFWRDSFYYYDISSLPVKATSAATTAWIVAHHTPLGAGPYLQFSPFGQSNWDSGAAAGYFSDKLPDGMDPNTSRRTWFANNQTAQHQQPHLYFSNLRQQNASKNFGQYTISTFGDRHCILWSESSNELMEAIGYNGFSASASHNVTYDLTSYDMPFGQNGVTKAGANATRIPIAPFFFTYQDLLDCGESGDLGHMLCFALEDYRLNVRQWPARAGDGTQTDTAGPVAGEVIRLRSDFDVSALPTAYLRALARTLQKYGAQLFDRGAHPRIITCNDPQWPSGIASLLGDAFQWSQFECVDLSSIEGDPDSIRVNVSSTGNLFPVASFTQSVNGGAAPLTVDFDASASSDPDGSIVSYDWDFGDGNTGTGVITSHTYLATGNFSPTLSVTDNDGASTSTAGTGWVPNYPLDTPPGTVRFGVSYTSSSGLPSKWEDPISKPVAMYRRFYSWSGIGNMDNEVVANHAAGRATWLSFKTPTTTTSWRDVAAGNYQGSIDSMLVSLRDTGINCWLTPYHEPEDNEASEAPGNNEALSGTVAEWRDMVRYVEQRRQAVGAENVLIVPIYMGWTFNPASGRDIDEWLLLDPEFPVIGVDPYTNDYGTSPARLTSTSFDAMTAKLESVGKDIALAEIGGAIGTSNVRPPELWEGYVAECLAHDIKACCWFDVGTNDLVNQAPADPTGDLYAAMLATFDSSLTYRDGLDYSATPSEPGSVTVTGTPVNVLPVAVAASSATSGVAPLAVSFSASGSYDPDGEIVSYHWNFGDSTTATGSSVSHVYSTSGVRTVTLTVTDDSGGQDTDTVGVTVSAITPGPSGCESTTLIHASVTVGYAPLAVEFDGSDSATCDGYVITGYSWNFGDGATATGATTSHTYFAAGVYTVTLTVTAETAP